MDFKSFKVDLSSDDFKAMSKGEGRAVIAEFNKIDHDGDVTLPGAFGKQHVNILPAHDRMAPRLGKGIMSESGGRAIADFKFNLDPAAKTALEWHSALKFDMENGEPLQEWSYGFKIIDSSFGEFEGKQVRFLKLLDVIEISPVLRGAGTGTGTLAVKNKKMTYLDEMNLATASLDDVKAFIERSQSLVDLKAKDGNSLSDDQIETLKMFKTSLDEVESKCKGLIGVLAGESIDSDEVQEVLAKCKQTLFRIKNC
jgi:hypothetical protein